MIVVDITPITAGRYQVRAVQDNRLLARIERDGNKWFAYHVNNGPWVTDEYGDIVPFKTYTDAAQSTREHFAGKHYCISCGIEWHRRECPPCAAEYRMTDYADDRITGSRADVMEYGEAILA